MKNDWEYGDYCQKYNMSGEIQIGTGIVKVHNIFDELPAFMKSADCVFCDPPCSKQNINSFYTKAGRTDYQEDYKPFFERFFQIVDEIKPKNLFIEVFKSNKEDFMRACKERYIQVAISESTYYHSKKNKCWIIQATSSQPIIRFNGIDEQDAIELICKAVNFECIADPCMGKGLVGYYANKYGKKFVGTELNPKRLAVMFERINTGKLIMR